MTRKNYQDAADRIRRLAVGRLLVATFMCSFFKSDNPRFDAERFMKACGLEGE